MKKPLLREDGKPLGWPFGTHNERDMARWLKLERVKARVEKRRKQQQKPDALL